MLQSHMRIGLNLGLTAFQLGQMLSLVETNLLILINGLKNEKAGPSLYLLVLHSYNARST